MPNSANNLQPLSRKRPLVNWTINLGDLITMVALIMMGVTAYFDVKSDVRNVKTYTDQKFSEYDERWKLQKESDEQQNQRMLRIYTELGTQLRDTKNEIKADIRELRTDLTVRGVRSR